MKPFALIGLLFLTLIIQATLAPLVAIGGVRPDLLLIIVVSTGLLLGKDQGVGMGFFAGLFQDLASGNIFGLNTFSKMVTGYLTGMMERKIFKENILLPPLAIFLATLFSGGMAALLLWSFNYLADWPSALRNLVFSGVYNAVLALPLHRLVYRLAGITPNDMPGARR